MDALIEGVGFFGLSFVPLTIGFVAAAKMAGLASRYAPLMSMLVGIGLMLLSGAELGRGIVLGIATGAAASGLYDFGKRTVADR